MGGRSRNLYTGIPALPIISNVGFGSTKSGLVKGFTSLHRINRLVYFETGCDIRAAISREKPIKGWLRSKKIELIESRNPTWADLSEDWYPKADPSLRSG
jgi:putative endonuclease